MDECTASGQLHLELITALGVDDGTGIGLRHQDREALRTNGTGKNERQSTSQGVDDGTGSGRWHQDREAARTSCTTKNERHRTPLGVDNKGSGQRHLLLTMALGADDGA